MIIVSHLLCLVGCDAATVQRTCTMEQSVQCNLCPHIVHLIVGLSFHCGIKFSYCITLLSTILVMSGTDGNTNTNLHITTCIQYSAKS